MKSVFIEEFPSNWIKNELNFNLTEFDFLVKLFDSNKRWKADEAQGERLSQAGEMSLIWLESQSKRTRAFNNCSRTVLQNVVQLLTVTRRTLFRPLRCSAL